MRGATQTCECAGRWGGRSINVYCQSARSCNPVALPACLMTCSHTGSSRLLSCMPLQVRCDVWLPRRGMKAKVVVKGACRAACKMLACHEWLRSCHAPAVCPVL